jgi:CHASE3 domain sensor protein
VENSFLSILALVALGLLVTVTGGIVYLTLADWRDRRRQDQEKRSVKQTARRR